MNPLSIVFLPLALKAFLLIRKDSLHPIILVHTVRNVYNGIFPFNISLQCQTSQIYAYTSRPSSRLAGPGVESSSLDLHRSFHHPIPLHPFLTAEFPAIENIGRIFPLWCVCVVFCWGIVGVAPRPVPFFYFSGVVECDDGTFDFDIKKKVLSLKRLWVILIYLFFSLLKQKRERKRFLLCWSVKNEKGDSFVDCEGEEEIFRLHQNSNAQAPLKLSSSVLGCCFATGDGGGVKHFCRSLQSHSSKFFLFFFYYFTCLNNQVVQS